MNEPLAKYAEDLERLTRPGIVVTCKPVVEAKLRVGASRMGGRPDLPNDVSWPTLTRQKGKQSVVLPLAFLGQIALSDVAKHDHEKLLPKSGLLTFFSLDVVRLSNAGVWTKSDFEAADRTVVLYSSPKSKLVRRAPPIDLAPEYFAPAAKPSFKVMDTYPQIESNVLSEKRRPVKGTLVLDAAAWRTWAAEAPENAPQQMLGHPRGCEYPIGNDPETRLLLSLEARSSGLPWSFFGRNGFLFFRISEASLREGRWSEVRHKEW